MEGCDGRKDVVEGCDGTCVVQDNCRSSIHVYPAEDDSPTLPTEEVILQCCGLIWAVREIPSHELLDQTKEKHHVCVIIDRNLPVA